MNIKGFCIVHKETLLPYNSIVWEDVWDALYERAHNMRDSADYVVVDLSTGEEYDNTEVVIPLSVIYDKIETYIRNDEKLFKGLASSILGIDIVDLGPNIRGSNTSKISTKTEMGVAHFRDWGLTIKKETE